MLVQCTLLLLPALLVPTSALYHVAQTHPAASDDNPGTADRPWATVGKAAGVMEAGDRVIVHAGEYREYIEPRNSGRPGSPIVYEAAEGEQVILTGADLITDWQRLEGDRPVYRTPWPHKFIINHVDGKPIYHHPADEEHLRSGRAEQIVVAGQAWDFPQIVLSLDDMTPGTFFPDVDAEVLYLWLPDGSDPADHRIEGSTRSMIFGTNPWRRREGFDYVQARGFTFRYAATFAQRPAVWLLGRHNLVEDCIIEWMSGGGVGVGPEGGILRRCIIRHCGHTGGCAIGRHFLNEDCVWEDNCRKPISRGWDAGGVKICGSHDGVFQRCVFRGNGGPGLWLDIDDSDVVIRSCLFVDNEQHGLFIEISRNIYVINNVFLRNGLRATGFTWSLAGLTLAESRNCVICNNLLVGNWDGLDLREQGPRYLDTPDLGRVPFQNVGHVIIGNVCAFNAGYQLGLWYDSAFFGRHPGETEKYKTEEEHEAAIKRDAPDRWFDPLEQGLVIDRNLYWPGTPEDVARATAPPEVPAAWIPPSPPGTATDLAAAAGPQPEGERPGAPAGDQGGQAAAPALPQPKLFLYGASWRVRHREFTDPASLAEATGFEVHGRVADPGLEALEGGLWRLSRDGLAFRLNVGPRHGLPGVPDPPSPVPQP